jgi:hypothetical protein
MFNLFYPEIDWRPETGTSQGRSAIDREVAWRIAVAYRYARERFDGAGVSSLWAGIAAMNGDLDALLAGDDMDALAARLNEPAGTDLFYGFDRLARSLKPVEVNYICDRLVRLAEATGAVHAWHPESAGRRKEPVDIEKLFHAIEQAIGIELVFPNPFSGEFGLVTRRGITSLRAIDAIYQAWRIKELSGMFGARVLEIGAGMGRTAYFARAFGLNDFVIVDLPHVNVSQAAFLCQVLGPDRVCLPGESLLVGQVRICEPAWLFDGTDEFDAVLNVDSMPEMARSAAEKYAAVIRGRSKAFLSINHEGAGFTTRSLAAQLGKRIYRAPYWLRDGYVEELFVN